MLIPFSTLVSKYKLNISGILHIGAHLCEEKRDYNNCGIPDTNIIWIEGNPSIVNRIKKNIPNVYQGLISDTVEEVEFIITNNGQSSSFLELEEHKREHPHVVEVGRLKMNTTTIPLLFAEHNITPSFNFINLDIQGAELKALKGMESMLSNVQYIYSEVNTKYLYSGCALLEELDLYLQQHGFSRVDISMTRHGWGDAFYIKN
jgi:FkbM family methyltransferase